MTADRPPTDARELRQRLANWPQTLVLRAVLDAYDEVGPTHLHAEDRRIVAGFITAWLTDPEISQARLDDPPPVSCDLLAAIWRYARESRQ